MNDTVKRKQGSKSSPKDVFLSVVFLTVLLSGFLGIAYASNVYEQGNGITDKIFETDSNTDFPDYSLDADYIATDNPETWTLGTGMHLYNTTGYYQVNYTPAYLGNNTWVSFVDEYALGNYQLDWHTVMNTPNLKDYIATDIYINITLPDDTDKLIGIAFEHHDLVIATESGAPRQDQYTYITNIILTDEVNYSGHIAIPLLQGHRVFDLSQDADYTDIVIIVGDEDHTGMSAWACEWDLQIYGQKVVYWSLETSVSVILGATSFMGIITAVYMTDSIDLKTIKQDRRGKR